MSPWPRSSPRPEPPFITPDRLAIIDYRDGAEIEALLAGFTLSLKQRGVAVGGLLQQSSREANGRPRMELIDIASGEVFLISQNLGAQSRSCCVDVTGVATAAVALRRAVAASPDLLVINKFSGLEAEGGGLRAEFLDALSGGIPLLTTLSQRHLDAFAAMTGGAGQFLPAQLPVLESWWNDVKAA